MMHALLPVGLYQTRRLCRGVARHIDSTIEGETPLTPSRLADTKIDNAPQESLLLELKMLFIQPGVSSCVLVSFDHLVPRLNWNPLVQ
jgi:hypothetical protein